MSMMYNMFFFVLVIGFAIYGFISLFIKSSDNKENKAIMILKERYAEGKIDSEEYHEKLKELKI